jgi:hypothetical protein
VILAMGAGLSGSSGARFRVEGTRKTRQISQSTNDDATQLKISNAMKLIKKTSIAKFKSQTPRLKSQVRTQAG